MAAEDGEKRSAIDDLNEGFQTLRSARASFTWWMMHIVPAVAVLYGAVAWRPYFLLLGLAGLALIVVLRRMDRTRAQAPRLVETRTSVDASAGVNDDSAKS